MESDKKSGCGGGMVVEESSSDVQNDRRQFYVELKTGETTIVSWTKLLKDSGCQVDQFPPPSPEPPKEYNQEKGSRSQCSSVVLKKERKKTNNGSLTTKLCQPKKHRTSIAKVLDDSNVVQAPRNTKLEHVRVKSTPDETYYDKKRPILSASATNSMGNPSDNNIKSGSSPCGITSNRDAICAESQSITSMSHINEEHSVNNGRIELPDLNIPYTQATNTSPTCIKDESGGMVSGTMLENTIVELENMVAESRPLHTDVQDAYHLVATTKSRLPENIKQKLEIVARLAHSIHGRIPDELITRLMTILGHWLKLRTLKRYLREMVPEDLSTGRGQGLRFSQMKKEVAKMINLRCSSLEIKDGVSNGTPELPSARKARYSMDYEMEDKACDLYDVYIQGMDEVKVSEIRKFYVQLAELWPKGTMDNHGIRNAICRAKERRRMLLQEKGHEKGKRKKSVNDINAPVLTFSDTVIPGTPDIDQNHSAPAKRLSPPSSGSCKNLLVQGKFDVKSSSMEVSLEIGNKVKSPLTE